MVSRCLLLATLMVTALGCSEDKGEAAPVPPAEATWSRLIEGSWTLGGGEERERECVKKTLTEDIYISALRPLQPLGTHHSILTLGDGDCTAAVANGLVYASAVGSEGLTLPKGVAIKLPKGQTLNLGLHIYNTSDEPLTGTSGIDIVTMDPADVEYESETVLAGPLQLSIPPRQTSTTTYDCAVTTTSSVYAIFPHMHQLGRRIETSFLHDGTPTYVRDEPFTFQEQLQIPLDPEQKLVPGDVVHTECTFENDTAQEVKLGESTDTEMCFSVLFRYPAGGGSFCLPPAP